MVMGVSAGGAFAPALVALGLLAVGGTRGSKLAASRRESSSVVWREVIGM
eukprot:CAMPEP_0201933550 /NCGR_PEP_ID=MMETSP0903-20130614/31805_1 /ASSEMBLY_ACC=CAM_ASM_000552 /TAXON_ID=420261 /ORGANISM="Thalassiosira antarctica, Strain CCMP982" /LENGTH=49 /DNA_ID= /DNA_START= /DNA_END= /DNA_ORIENTATION=